MGSGCGATRKVQRVVSPPLLRSELINDETLRGRAFCSAYGASVESWLADLFDEAAGGGSGQVAGLALLGLVALPKYGGNRDKLGWQLLGFEDRHFWQPPFGHYDADYPGFEPYPRPQPFTA